MAGQVTVTNVVPMEEGDAHHYVSTACLHGEHRQCGVKQLARGDLGPPHCKYCESVCACPVCDHPAQGEREDELTMRGHIRQAREHATQRGPVIV
jgi:hypothetical protein